MDKDWILFKNETRRTFSRAAWIPLRAIRNDMKGNARDIGYTDDFFGCGAVAFPPEHREIAERLGWSDIGIDRTAHPYAYEDGYYSSIEQYQYNDKDPIGVQFVFEHPQPVVGGSLWILNPDLIVALHLIKEGTDWVRPEEDFVVVAREVFDEKGNHCLIEIKREFLIDYLAARNLSLRLSYYYQRIENIATLEHSVYANLTPQCVQRDGGRFELRIRNLEDIFGGSLSLFRTWRTDINEDEDVPIMEPEREDNTNSEQSQGYRGGYNGVLVSGEFWRDEWIEHQGKSVRVRGDVENTLPQFIIDTDGTRMNSADLNYEDIGRWLWFSPSVVKEILTHRGFSLEWYTANTGGLYSTSGYSIHFGINDSDLITVYAYDIARIASWEQRIWYAYNIAPEGKVCSELLAAQVETEPASTRAVEELLLEGMRVLAVGFREKFKVELFTHDIDESVVIQQVSRFACMDQSSLLRLAKELIRLFSDRINVRELRNLSNNVDKEKLGSNKLLQDILAMEIGIEQARDIFSVIAGTYDMRIGDAHPTGSKIRDALKLAKINENLSFLRQGEQLINNFGRSIWQIGKLLFANND